MPRPLLVFAASLGFAALLSGSALASSGDPAKPTTKPDPTPPVKVYVVQEGDNLSSIAQAENLESWKPLWDANTDIQDPNLIFANQQLTVPSGPTTDRPLPADTVNLPQRTYVPQGGQIYSNAGSGQNYAAGAPGLLARIRSRESGGNYAENTGNGFYGAYQFTVGTWQSVGGSGLPSNASPSEQDMRAQMLMNERGCSPWPNTCY